MTQFIFCNSYCLPGVTEEENDLELQRTLRDEQPTKTANGEHATKHSPKIERPKPKHKAKKKEISAEVVKSRASVKLKKSTALTHYKILNDNSIHSSCESDDENSNTNNKNKKKKAHHYTKTIDKSNDRNTERVSGTPTTNSLNNNLQKKAQDKSADKSNDKSNSKSADKTNPTRDNILMKMNSKSKNPKNLKESSIYDLNQAYTKLSKKKIMSTYDENAIYGKPSASGQTTKNPSSDFKKNNAEQEEQNNGHRNADNSIEDDHEATDDDDEENMSNEQEEIEEEEEEEEDNSLKIKKAASNDYSNGLNWNSKYSESRQTNERTLHSHSKDIANYSSDRFQQPTSNKNLEYLVKNNVPLNTNNAAISNKLTNTQNIVRQQETNKSNPAVNKNLAFLFNSQSYNQTTIPDTLSSFQQNKESVNQQVNNNYNNYNLPSNQDYRAYNDSRFNNYEYQANNINQFSNLYGNQNPFGPSIDNNNSYKPFRDTLSCSYCEEFYKMALFQNLPLQLLSCPYCNNTLNQSSLQFYYKKYEEELNKAARKVITTDYTQTNASKQTSYKNSPRYGTNENNNLSTLPTKNQSIVEDVKTQVFRQPSKQPTYKQKELKEIIDSDITSDYKPPIEVFKNERAKTKKTEARPKEEETYLKQSQQNPKEIISIKVNDEQEVEGESLAEMFKKKKNRLIEKLEKRKTEKENIPEKKEVEIEKPEKPKKELKRIIKKVSSEQKISLDSKSPKSKEPSPELLHRLSLGEKINLSKKEMKKLNLRLVSALPEVKKQEYDEKSKQESQKRFENTKSFAQKLKDDVLKSKKVNA